MLFLMVLHDICNLWSSIQGDESSVFLKEEMSWKEDQEEEDNQEEEE